MEHIESAIKTIDKLLDVPLVAGPLKALFGLQELMHDDDFVSVLQEPLGSVQATNWDPSESTDAWDRFCEVLTSGGAGKEIGLVRIPAEVVNYANWIRKEVVAKCSETVEEVREKRQIDFRSETNDLASVSELTTMRSSKTQDRRPGGPGCSKCVPSEVCGSY